MCINPYVRSKIQVLGERGSSGSSMREREQRRETDRSAECMEYHVEFLCTQRRTYTHRNTEAKATRSYVTTDEEKSLCERVQHLGNLADDAEARDDRHEAAARHEDRIEVATAAAAAREGERRCSRRSMHEVTPHRYRLMV